MATTEYYKRMMSYDAWATQQTLHSLQQAPEQSEKAVKLLAHILAAHRIWHARVTGQDTRSLSVWPEASLEALEPQVEERRRGWQDVLAAMPEEGLQRIVEYTNTKGAAYSNTVADIIAHVLFHGMYHRAQIASMVKAGGGVPAATDFIAYVRES